jgi:alkylhydroperoxidase/carboxymuconolactone decarboxylase family protein YurZ
MEGHGLRHLGAPKNGGDSDHPAATTRIDELVSIGAAFAVNCTSNLEKHLQAGQAVGITEAEVREVVKLSAFIKTMAASHVEKLVGVTQAVEAAPACCA